MSSVFKDIARQDAKARRRLAVSAPIYRRLNDRLASLLRTHRPRVIAAYHAIGREIVLDLPLLSHYGTLVLPRSMPGRRVLSFFPPQGPLSPDDAGVPAPPADGPGLHPDLILVPLLAFDNAGYRLGYGKGYYDASLAALRHTAPLTAVGVAAAGQHMDRVPTEPWDERLDGIITEHHFTLTVATSPDHTGASR
ncbi:MAG: 5-formyltetrahydrofolate cyclo-ligase [Pseudomonadota bacterium]